MDYKYLFELLAALDENHFLVVDEHCVEIYSKEEYFATPMSK